MLSTQFKQLVKKYTTKRQIANSVIAIIGYILSPLSWWNDMFVNVPLAYAFSWIFTVLDQRLFLPAFVLGYWLSNLLGFILLHHGAAGLVEHRKSSMTLRHTIIVTIIYTLIIVVLAWLGWIPSPDELAQEMNKHI